MKQELKDIAIELGTKTAPASGLTAISSHWWMHVNWTGVLTGVLVVLQIAYLLRKWWREETSWGQWLRRHAERMGMTPSKAMELDE